MSMVFPPAWQNLRFPHIRAELLEYLQSASDPALWNDTAEMEFLVHFVFDDHDFVGPGAVGDIFLNQEEGLAISAFVKALDEAIGPRSKKLGFMRERDWQSVPAAATEAHSLLIKSGTPTYD